MIYDTGEDIFQSFSVNKITEEVVG